METEETDTKYAALFSRYPELFRHSEDSREPLAMFGVECGVGWYNIIDKCCQTIYSKVLQASRQERYYKSYLENIPKYIAMRRYRTTEEEEKISDEQLVAELNEEYEKVVLERTEEALKLPRFVQIKEKFGTLRLYIDYGSEGDNMVTDYAEAMSSVTCELCGNSGKTYRIGWNQTLCNEHALMKYGKEKLDEYEKE